MKKYRYIIAAFALCAIAACSDDDFNVPTDAVRIDATIGENSIFTRSNPASTTEESETKFNLNDQISVTNVDRTATYTLTNSGWVANGNDYLRWYKEPLTFTARYPAGIDVGDNMSFTLVADQTADQRTEELIGNADFMVCRTAELTRPDNNTLFLQMQRMMARIIVRIKGFEDEFGADAEVENVTITSPASTVEVTFTDKNIPSATPLGDAIAITPFAQIEEGKNIGAIGTTYTAIVVPVAYTNKTVVTLTCKGKTMEAKVTLEVKAGHSYTLPLTVGKETIKIGTVSVAEWKGGSAIGEDKNIANVTD
mgnify:CR=1 FL=1